MQSHSVHNAARESDRATNINHRYEIARKVTSSARDEIFSTMRRVEKMCDVAHAVRAFIVLNESCHQAH